METAMTSTTTNENKGNGGGGVSLAAVRRRRQWQRSGGSGGSLAVSAAAAWRQRSGSMAAARQQRSGGSLERVLLTRPGTAQRMWCFLLLPSEFWFNEEGKAVTWSFFVFVISLHKFVSPGQPCQGVHQDSHICDKNHKL
jgi:hypothetical protein